MMHMTDCVTNLKRLILEELVREKKKLPLLLFSQLLLICVCL